VNFDSSLPGSYEYIHYTKAGVTAIDLSRSYPQTVKNLVFHAPNGLWLSVTGIHDWETYCLKNGRGLENLKSEFQVILKPDAKILLLHSEAVFMEFVKEYSFQDGIAWDKIISVYQGLVIPIVLPKLDNMGLWYDVWCCTSGCIWDLRAVEKAEKMI
jgi:hypothetical protein